MIFDIICDTIEITIGGSVDNCQNHLETRKERMKMRVTVCIGSSCHIKGSRQVVEQLQELITKNGLDDKVELAGTFCMNKCQAGVSVAINDEIFSVSPETATEFFEQNILNNI